MTEASLRRAEEAIAEIRTLRELLLDDPALPDEVVEELVYSPTPARECREKPPLAEGTQATVLPRPEVRLPHVSEHRVRVTQQDRPQGLPAERRAVFPRPRGRRSRR